MAASSLLALIDDIASILDDVAVLSKVAAKKTSGVLGDDLALNAEQVTGVSADRELPVVFKVAVGSFINKLILIPSALLVSSFAPILITPMLLLGGGFLCFEGFEKVFEKVMKLLNKSDKSQNEEAPEIVSEEQKIKGAIRTDFILSLEIMVIVLGTVQAAPILTRILVLSSVGIGMTFGVYGLVALIVKIDDFGLYLKTFSQIIIRKAGGALLIFAPLLMKTLGIAGTVAMFLVGGGIMTHGVPLLHHYQQNLSPIAQPAFDGLIGIGTGGIIVLLVHFLTKIKSKKTA